MRRRMLLVFLFFTLKRRRSRSERTTKEVQKRKYGLKKYSRKDKQKAHLIWVSIRMSLIVFIAKLPCNTLILRNNGGS